MEGIFITIGIILVLAVATWLKKRKRQLWQISMRTKDGTKDGCLVSLSYDGIAIRAYVDGNLIITRNTEDGRGVPVSLFEEALLMSKTNNISGKDERNDEKKQEGTKG
ncbi:MAG: hypothetical protein KAX20_08060 [Candidatus Omnitrophica bacterium]|nr:hypothetical protein [Candidatus Omnitrophota bacterium]